MAGLVFGPGTLTQGQLVALTSVTLVVLFLVTANVAVCWLYRRAVTQDERHRQRRQKQQRARVWVYHVHRTTHTIPGPNPESAAQQILRKLQASHHNLRAKLAAAAAAAAAAGGGGPAQDDYHRQNSLRREEAQALEELEVTTDLFLHDTNTSRASSWRSSLGSGSRFGSSRFLRAEWEGDEQERDSSPSGRFRSESTTSAFPDPQTVSALNRRDSDSLRWDFETASTERASDSASAALQELDEVFATYDLDASASSYDLDVASALAELDMASTLHDLDPDTDKVSMSSVTMADFVNDDLTDLGDVSPRRKRTRWSRGKGSGRRAAKGDHSQSFPVAEFHNEAFEFSETQTAVERMNDVEL